MAECPTEHMIAAFMEGRLGAEQRAGLLEHVDECPACSEVIAELARACHPAGPAADSGEDGPAQEGGPASVGPGTRVGRYRIQALLDEGGMGMVYTAYDPELNRKVALKLLRTSSSAAAAAPESRARLLREAQAMAQLSHPNVVAVHDVGTFGDQVFVAMELVEGGTLTRWIEAGPRSWQETLHMFVAAGRGLAAAHAVGLLHRDFKPDNVLVGAGGRVEVTDFGLACPAVWPDHSPALSSTAPAGAQPLANVAVRITRTGELLGTPAYMAPEQMRGEETDVRADVFSFCAALYEALHGQRPFEADTLRELHAAIAQDRVRAAPKHTPVPAYIRRVLLRGLRADPAQRYPSMDAVLDALSRLHRVRLNAAAAGLAACVLLGTGFLGYRYVTRHPHPAAGTTAAPLAATGTGAPGASIRSLPVPVRLRGDLRPVLDGERPTADPAPAPERPQRAAEPTPNRRPKRGARRAGARHDEISNRDIPFPEPW